METVFWILAAYGCIRIVGHAVWVLRAVWGLLLACTDVPARDVAADAHGARPGGMVWRNGQWLPRA